MVFLVNKNAGNSIANVFVAPHCNSCIGFRFLFYLFNQPLLSPTFLFSRCSKRYLIKSYRKQLSYIFVVHSHLFDWFYLFERYADAAHLYFFHTWNVFDIWVVKITTQFKMYNKHKRDLFLYLYVLCVRLVRVFNLMN